MASDEEILQGLATVRKYSKMAEDSPDGTI